MIGNESVKKICQSSDKLAGLAYEKVTYKEEVKDPMELPETIFTGFENDTHKEVSHTFADILKDA